MLAGLVSFIGSIESLEVCIQVILIMCEPSRSLSPASVPLYWEEQVDVNAVLFSPGVLRNGTMNGTTYSEDWIQDLQ
jgi:hypothetical protein